MCLSGTKIQSYKLGGTRYEIQSYKANQFEDNWRPPGRFQGMKKIQGTLEAAVTMAITHYNPLWL